MTLRFNREINKYCYSHNLYFLDLDPHSLNEAGIVKDKLKNLNLSGHHYNFDEYSKL